MNIEMTGRQDREGPWKIAVGGFPGAGKTMLASTASKPLFVFFQDNPRLKSIADRHIPHVKMTNETSTGGVVTVQDKLNMLVISLNLKPHDYQTLVVDTGDELFQSMKAGRRIKNGGEFGISDWGWIADAYRDVVTGLIDLPMDVIVLFHLKTSQDGEGGNIVRELMLQGQAQDEAPGWFDVVGALDTFEAANDEGDTITKRVLLTHSSRIYPWVKDHSGALPPKFPISDNFVGDMGQLMALLHAGDNLADREVIEEIEEVEEQPVGDPTIPIPKPDDLQAKKTEKVGKNPKKASTPKPTPEPEPEVVTEEEVEVQPETIPTETESVDESETPEADSPDEPSGDTVSRQPATVQDGEPQVTDEEAEATVIQELGAESVKVCAECGEEVKDTDLLELTQIRFRADLCRPHFRGRIDALRAS